MNTHLENFLYAIELRRIMLVEHEDKPIGYDPSDLLRLRREKDLREIDEMIQRYFNEAVAASIPNRILWGVAHE